LSVAAAAVLVVGYVQGCWSNRWGNTRAVEQAVERIERVPITIGNWQGNSLELGVREAEQAGFSGYWLRRYERPTDGATVVVMLACGRPGPLTVHTPEICYAGAGFVESGADKTTLGPGAASAEFWKATFAKPDALAPSKLRILWSWRTTAGWKAATNARWEFANQDVLFKIYVCHEMSGSDERQADAVCTDFLNVLLPALDQALAAERGSVVDSPLDSR
jgi:hypothetical protein